MTVTQVVKILPAFYWTWKFIMNYEASSYIILSIFQLHPLLIKQWKMGTCELCGMQREEDRACTWIAFNAWNTSWVLDTISCTVSCPNRHREAVLNSLFAGCCCDGFCCCWFPCCCCCVLFWFAACWCCQNIIIIQNIKWRNPWANHREQVQCWFACGFLRLLTWRWRRIRSSKTSVNTTST